MSETDQIVSEMGECLRPENGKRNDTEKRAERIGRSLRKIYEKSRNPRGFGNFLSYENGNIVSVALAFVENKERQPLKIVIGGRNGEVEGYVSGFPVPFLDRFCFSSGCEMQVYIMPVSGKERIAGMLGKAIGKSIRISMEGME